MWWLIGVEVGTVCVLVLVFICEYGIGMLNALVKWWGIRAGPGPFVGDVFVPLLVPDFCGVVLLGFLLAVGGFIV